MKAHSIWISEAPLVVAHRGASAYAPENTIRACQLAVEQGADALELDVKLTRDRIPILMHDPSLDRTTNGHGLVSRLTYADIANLDAGEWFGPAFSGERIPRLQDVLQRYGDHVLLNLELTNYSTPLDPLAGIVIRLVSEVDLADRVLLSSFNLLNMVRIRLVKPEIQLGLLLHERQPGWLRGLSRRMIPCSFLHLQENLALAELARSEDSPGKPIHVWTTNHEERIRQFMLQPRINGVITDVPDTACRIRTQFHAARQGKTRQSG